MNKLILFEYRGKMHNSIQKFDGVSDDSIMTILVNIADELGHFLNATVDPGEITIINIMG